MFYRNVSPRDLSCVSICIIYLYLFCVFILCICVSYLYMYYVFVSCICIRIVYVYHIFVFVAGFSIAVATIFSHSDLSGLINLLPKSDNNFQYYMNSTRMEWPFYLHICSAVLNSSAVVMSIVHETRLRRHPKVDPVLDDKDITVLALDAGDIEEYRDLL